MLVQIRQALHLSFYICPITRENNGLKCQVISQIPLVYITFSLLANLFLIILSLELYYAIYLFSIAVKTI